MQLSEARNLAIATMAAHGLTDWKFKFDRSKTRFGLCRYAAKTISLSAAMTELNEEPAVLDTLLHEIAHALVGPSHGHGMVWWAKAKAIGCNGERYHNATVPEGKFKGTCPNCGYAYFRYRKYAAKCN